MRKGLHSRYELEKARKESNYGTTAKRLGKDSLVPFGYCSLTVTPIESDPVATPSGHIYEREKILQYLLASKQKIKEQQQAYEDEQMELKEKEKLNELQKKQTELEEFKKLNKTFTTSEEEDTKTSSSSTESILGKRDYKDYIVERQTKKRVDDRSKEEKLSELSHTSYWLSQFTPTAENKLLKKPDSRPKSPISGKPLKLKNLISFNLQKDPSDPSKFLCAISKKTITHQKVVLIIPSKAVVLKSCFEQVVKPTMICPITGVKLDVKDVKELKSGGTSFSQHNNVEAKSYRPNLI